jgi:hypothetical protein
MVVSLVFLDVHGHRDMLCYHCSFTSQNRINVRSTFSFIEMEAPSAILMTMSRSI